MNRNDMMFWAALSGLIFNAWRGEVIGALFSLAGLVLAYFLAPDSEAHK